MPKSPPPLPNALPVLGAPPPSVFVVEDPPPNRELGTAALEVDVLFPNIPPVVGLLPPKMPPPPRVVDPEGAAVLEVDVPLPNNPPGGAVGVLDPNRPPDGAGFADDWGEQLERERSSYD